MAWHGMACLNGNGGGNVNSNKNNSSGVYNIKRRRYINDQVSVGTFGFRFPIFQPQPRSVLTTLGVNAAVMGTRTKIKDLWMA